MTGPLVTGAPFSADASTLVTQTLGDGTRIEQRVTAKFYRDSAGRVRREQTIIGLDALTPAAPARTLITFDSVPGDPMPYVIDPVARTARRMPRAQFQGSGGLNLTLTFLVDRLAGGGRTITRQPDLGDPADPGFQRELERATNLLAQAQNQLGERQNRTASPAAIPADVRPTEEELGTRQMEGVKAIGRRTTAVIPINRVGNDQPITITDERWESPELGLIVYSRFSDPRTGVVEYRLSGINRSEPRADLFTVPQEYTVIGAPGLRGGGGGGRGGTPQP
jgi:hypothetical protein